MTTNTERVKLMTGVRINGIAVNFVISKYNRINVIIRTNQN